MAEGKEQVEAMENLNFLQQNDKGLKLIKNIYFECTLTLKLLENIMKQSKGIYGENTIYIKRQMIESCAKRF